MSLPALTAASSDEIVDWVMRLDAGSFPSTTVEKVSLAALHYLHCAAVGGTRSASRATAQALGLNGRGAFPAHIRALYNGLSSHTTLQEDMHVASQCHIGVVVFSALLALAAEHQITGKRFVGAAVAGYEVMGRVGESLARAGLSRRFRPTGICGPLGAWAAVSYALGLDHDDALSALGLAANAAAGLNGWAWQGGEEVFLHAGLATQAGVLSAGLASTGVRGSPEPLFGTAGFLEAFGDESSRRYLSHADWTARSEQLVLDEVIFKPHPGCNYVQTVVDICERLHTPGPGPFPAPVGLDITVSTPAARYPGCDNPGPWRTRLEAQMSIQFAAAATLLTGDYALALDMPAAEWEARFGDLAKRSSVQTSGDIDAAYPGAQGARVTVSLEDGNRLQAEQADLRGLSEAEVRTNVERLSELGSDFSTIAEILHDTGRLVDLPSVSPLARNFSQVMQGAALAGLRQ